MKLKPKDRKIQISFMLRADQISFLDKKVTSKNDNRESRSAVIGLLIDSEMAKPAILN